MFKVEQINSTRLKGTRPGCRFFAFRAETQGMRCRMPGGSVPERRPNSFFQMKETSAAQQDIRFRVLRLLQARPELTQREIARELGVSLGGVNFCLRALVDKGLVKIRNFQNSKNRTAYLYLLTPKGIRAKMALTEAFLKRRLAEYRALRAEIQALGQTLPGAEFESDRQNK